MDAIHRQNAYIIISHSNSVLIAESNTDNTNSIAKETINKLSKFMREFKKKEDVIGTVIKCTSVKQGRLIIKFYEALGIENDGTLMGNSVGIYYGPASTGVIDTFHDIPKGYKRIRPRLVPKYVPKAKFPRIMWVSNNKVIWIKATVIARISKFDRKYICTTSKVDEHNTMYTGFMYAKEINN